MSLEILVDEVVLFVDDDSAIIEYYRSIAAKMEVKGLFANSAEQAMELLSGATIFLVITDLKMGPGLNGIELSDHMRKIGLTMPIILATGFADKQTAIDGLRIGITDIVEKPFDKEELVGIIDKYMDLRSFAILEAKREKEEMLQYFLAEAKNIVHSLEKEILELERSPLNQDSLNELYRLVHTLKGSTGTVEGTGSIQKLVHYFEDALSVVKEQAKRPVQDVIDTFLEVEDVLNQLIAAISDKRNVEPDINSVCSRLEDFFKNPRFADEEVSDNKPVKESDESPRVDSSYSEEGITVSSKKLDHFMSLGGDLVAFKNIFEGFVSSCTQHDPKIKSFGDQLKKMLGSISEEIQSQIMEVRKVSLSQIFSQYPRLVRQIAADQSKQINLQINGAETQVDKVIAKVLNSSLIHAVRNSCDHGIEDPNERHKLKKPLCGNLLIEASESDGFVNISISDDGQGLDRSKILASAITAGLIAENAPESMTDQDVFELIFNPGFSTKQEVTDISGRGVGMDALTVAVRSIGGCVSIDSTLGLGMALHIKIPVPKSVMVEQSVVVKSKGVAIVVPLTSVAEIGKISENNLNFVQDRWTTQFRDQTIPLACYDQWLGDQAVTSLDAPSESELLVVIKHDSEHIGLRVESISDLVQAVIRPFDPLVGGIKGFDGVTVLSDNSVAYVLSSEQLLNAALDKVS